MIPTNLKILSIIFLVIILLVITFFVQKNKITVKYSIIWYLCDILLIILVLFPTLLTWFTDLFNIELESNFIFALLILFLLVLTISLTIIVSEQKEKIRTLIQELSIVKEIIDKND